MSNPDLMIEVSARTGGNFRIKTLFSPFHLPEVETRPPYPPADTEAFLDSIDERMKAIMTDHSNAKEIKSALRLQKEDIGLKLFEFLFQEGLADLIERSLVFSRSQAQPDTYLPIRLVFDPDQDNLSSLTCLPWELTYCNSERQYFGLDRRMPVTRYLALNSLTPVLPLQNYHPLRVLVVSSSPSNLRELDLETERKQICEALGTNRDIAVDFYDRPTVVGLHQRLLYERFHILHFMGHGAFNRVSAEGALAFVSSDGKDAYVPGDRLATALRGIPHLRLVVLSACYGATIRRHMGQTPYSSMVPALLRAGIPAVVAMQFPISDLASITFSQAFYTALAHGDPVDLAAVSGRQAIHGTSEIYWEWMTPAVFTRVRDGRIFAAGDSVEREPSPDRNWREVAANSIGPQASIELKLSFPGKQPLSFALPIPCTSEHGYGDFLENDKGYTSTGVPEIFQKGESATSSFPSLIRLGFSSLGEDKNDFLKRETDRLLEIHEYFEGEIAPAPQFWEEIILPEIKTFFSCQCTAPRLIQLDFATDKSVAFLVGYCLDYKSALEITIRQRRRDGTADWWSQDGEAPSEPLWREDEENTIDESAVDVALAVSVSRSILNDIRDYVRKSDLEIRSIRSVSMLPSPGPLEIRNGAHLLRLAQELANMIRRSSMEPAGNRVLHLFVAAPSAFLFFLGQFSRDLGAVQLYECGICLDEAPIFAATVRLPLGT